MVSWLLWHKTDTEPGIAQGLHPGGDVGVCGGHQDLQVTLASIASSNYTFILLAGHAGGHSLFNEMLMIIKLIRFTRVFT
jgi:hypothetical protein